MTKAHQTQAYRSWRKQVLAHCEPVCLRCGHPVDMTLPGTHPDGPTADHEPPLVETGEVAPTLDQAGISHARCNRSHGGRIGSMRRQQQLNDQRTTRRSTTTRTKSASTTPPRSLNEPSITPAPPIQNLSTGTGDAPRTAVKAPESLRYHPDGFPYPRIETPPHGGCTGSYGPRAREWMAKRLGMNLRGWQAYACDRALEHDAQGELIWRWVLLTVARQSGKSTLARGLVLWRMHEGRDLFGEQQLVLSVANKLPTAWEVMLPALEWVRETYGKECVREGNNRPGVTLPSKDRWVPLAAMPGAGTGYSAAMLFADEVWQIKERVITDDLAPTMAERISPQAYLSSTAGDAESVLFESMRAKAIDQIGRQAEGRSLLLEWSAPPDADADDMDTWRWASPEWSQRREEFLLEQHSSISPDSFATQYLNRWVRRIDGWLNSRTWAQTTDPDRDLPADRPWTVVCEVAKDGSSHGVAIAAEDSDGRIVVRLHAARTYKDVDDLVEQLRRGHPQLELFITPAYVDRLRTHTAGMVGHGQAASATHTLLDAFTRGIVAHDGSPLLEEQMFRADIRKVDSAYVLVGRGPVSAHGARAVMFAIWQATRVQKATAAVHVRRG